MWLHQVLAAAGGLLRGAVQTLGCGTHVGSGSLTRDQTPAPCVGSVESQPLCHQKSPPALYLSRGYIFKNFDSPKFLGNENNAVTPIFPQIILYLL